VKRALVTGAAGFIGGYVVEEFVRAGWRVVAAVHGASSPRLAALARRGRVTVAGCDAGSLESLERAVNLAGPGGGRGPDAIVHCAGRASDVGRDREFRRTNYDSVRHLVKLTRDSGAGRLVFVSTTDVYGLRDFSGESEDELPLDPFPRNPYPRWKIAAERHVRAELVPRRWSIIRPAAVWGVGDSTFVPRLVAFLRSTPFIVHFGKWRGSNRWPLAHVRNVAAASYLAAVLPRAAGRAFNVLDSEVTTADGWYRAVAALYLPGREFRSVTVPLWCARLFGAVVSAVSTALNLRRPLIDPSRYAAEVVSNNLDFGNGAFLELLAAGGRAPVTKSLGMRELASSAQALASECRLKRKPMKTYEKMKSIIPSSGLKRARRAAWPHAQARKFVISES